MPSFQKFHSALGHLPLKNDAFEKRRISRDTNGFGGDNGRVSHSQQHQPSCTTARKKVVTAAKQSRDSLVQLPIQHTKAAWAKDPLGTQHLSGTWRFFTDMQRSVTPGMSRNTQEHPHSNN